MIFKVLLRPFTGKRNGWGPNIDPSLQVLQKKYAMENFDFCAVLGEHYTSNWFYLRALFQLILFPVS